MTYSTNIHQVNKPYDRLSPYTLEELVRNETWVINRALFLINLKDSHMDRFCGGLCETHEEWIESAPNRFLDEYNLLATRCPKQFNRAFGIYSCDWETKTISYLKGGV